MDVDRDRGELFHVVDREPFDRPLLEELCAITTRIRTIAKTTKGARRLQKLLAHRRAMLYFTQPSTRTFLSFNNACHVLGIRTSEIRDRATSSEMKGESFLDGIRTFSSYVDVIVMRTANKGEAAEAAAHLDSTARPIPVINGGSGPDQHPTQALLDIYTLDRSFEERGGIDGKTVVMMGDLRRGRTVRSLSYLLCHYDDVQLIFVAPPRFAMQSDVKRYLRERNVSFSETEDLPEALRQADALYATRMQFEYEPGSEADATADRYRVGPDELALMRQDAVLMHPLPRGPELDPAIDADPRVMYWRQERNGMWMRAALLVKIFGVDGEL